MAHKKIKALEKARKILELYQAGDFDRDKLAQVVDTLEKILQRRRELKEGYKRLTAEAQASHGELVEIIKHSKKEIRKNLALTE